MSDIKSVEDIVAAVASIRLVAEADDYETAHDMEDELHQSVLRHIANESQDAESRAFAQAALASLDIDFVRYTA